MEREKWLPDIIRKKILITDGVDPLGVLATPAEQAGWKNEGLPSDIVSLENASVIVSCSRWPLIIDPQLQGQKWIRSKEGINIYAEIEPSIILIELYQNRYIILPKSSKLFFISYVKVLHKFRITFGEICSIE